MSFSDFTLKKVKEDFQLTLVEQDDLFASCAEVEVDEDLVRVLDENVPLALAINTEKARSELIIAPVLVALRRRFERKLSLFSGIDFAVDREQNLNGICDFIISRSAEQFYVAAPVVAVVEAKKENIVGGLGQCLAEMVAARVFNQQENTGISSVYGAVTTGSAWKFLKLGEEQGYIDLREYHIEGLGKIMGILSAMVEQEA